MNRDKLLQCEDAFAACFATVQRGEGAIRFRDDNITDMYDHNYTVLTGDATGEQLAGHIRAEMALCKSEGKNYCQVRLDGTEAPVVDGLAPETMRLGLYQRACDTPLPSAGNPNCTVLRAADALQMDDRLAIELAGYESANGADFCRRKTARNAAVYLAPGGVDTYICYAGGAPVGKADLFLCGEIAMIEDFDVAEPHQHKGYGTAILRTLLAEAAERGAKTAMLVTDMDEPAKDLYEKLGFTWLPGRTRLFYRLEA